MSTAAHSLWKWIAVCCLVVCVMLSTLCPAHAKRLWVASVTVVDSRLLEHGPSALKGKDAGAQHVGYKAGPRHQYAGVQGHVTKRRRSASGR